MLSLPNYALYVVHANGEERKLNPDEKPLLVQLNWHNDDREGRFLLKNCAQKTNVGGECGFAREHGKLRVGKNAKHGKTFNIQFLNFLHFRVCASIFQQSSTNQNTQRAFFFFPPADSRQHHGSAELQAEAVQAGEKRTEEKGEAVEAGLRWRKREPCGRKALYR